jgi:hypothetical protein
MERRDSEHPDAIQKDIHRTRERIDETLDAIKQQLSPGDLMSQVMSMFRKDGGGGMSSKAGDVLSSLARTVKENPIPVALIGIGLLGLAKDGGDHKARSVGERKPGEHDLEQAAGQVAKKVQEVAAEARESLERGYEQVRQRVEDDPIVLGALGIALGAALGAGLPSTRIEDEALGEKRDELAAKAKQVAEQIHQEAKQVADETMQALES